MFLDNNFFIIFLPSIKTLQFYLLPTGAFLGMGLGILLTNTKFAQKWPWATFWLMVMLDLIVLKLIYTFFGDIWTRISFSFLMGYFAFSLKLLR
jgi:hypothetical protein